MKHVVAVRADYYQELEESVEEKLQELQINGKNMADISLGGRGAELVDDCIDNV